MDSPSVPKRKVEATVGDSLDALEVNIDEAVLFLNFSDVRNKNCTGKKRFQSRKQNSKKYRKAKRGMDYQDRLAAKNKKSKRKRKMKNRRRFKPYD